MPTDPAALVAAVVLFHAAPASASGAPLERYA